MPVQRRRSCSVRAALLGVLVSSLAHASDPATWRECRSPHFRILATWSDEELRATAARIERFRSVILTDCCGGDPSGGAPITLVFLPRAQPLEKVWGTGTWGRVLSRPERLVVTYGRPLQWILTPSALGPERAVLIARAILADAAGPTKDWKPWRLRAYAAYVGTAEAGPGDETVLLGRVNQPSLQRGLDGPPPDQTLLDRWDGTDRWLGPDADAVLEGMGYIVLVTELEKLPPRKRPDLFRYFVELGTSHPRPIQLQRPAAGLEIRPASEAEVSSLLSAVGVSP